MSQNYTELKNCSNCLSEEFELSKRNLPCGRTLCSKCAKKVYCACVLCSQPKNVFRPLNPPQGTVARSSITTPSLAVSTHSSPSKVNIPLAEASIPDLLWALLGNIFSCGTSSVLETQYSKPEIVNEPRKVKDVLKTFDKPFQTKMEGMKVTILNDLEDNVSNDLISPSEKYDEESLKNWASSLKDIKKPGPSSIPLAAQDYAKENNVKKRLEYSIAAAKAKNEITKSQSDQTNIDQSIHNVNELTQKINLSDQSKLEQNNPCLPVIPVISDIPPKEIETTERRLRLLFRPKRNEVWRLAFGDCPESHCWCGELITPKDFQYGFIKSFIQGGKFTLDNIKPICLGCKEEMGTMGLEEYKESFDTKLPQDTPPKTNPDQSSCQDNFQPDIQNAGKMNLEVKLDHDVSVDSLNDSPVVI